VTLALDLDRTFTKRGIQGGLEKAIKAFKNNAPTR